MNDNKASCGAECSATLGVLGCLLLAAVVAAAAAQSATAQPAAQASSEYALAQKAFEDLPETRRKEIQDSLVWTGDYKGGVDGEFGRMTLRAIQAYESRGKGDRDGILSLRDIAALTREAIRRKDAVQFRQVLEPNAGVRIGLPMKLLVKRKSPGGAIFQSRDKTLLVRTFTVPESRQTLPELYGVLRAPASGVRTSYSVLRSDFLVVTTQSKSRFTYIRAARVANGPGGDAILRGYTFSVAQSVLRQRREQVDILTIAISNSFDPDPGKSPAGEKVAKTPTDTGKPVPAVSPVPAEHMIATALAIAPDMYLTVLGAGQCRAVRIGKAPAQSVASDRATGLALFRAPVGGGIPASSLTAGIPASGPAFGLFAELPYPGGDPQISLARGQLASANGSNTARILMPHSAAGGIVVTEDGQVAGLVAAEKPITSQPAKVRIAGLGTATSLPQIKRELIEPAKVRSFLAGAGLKTPAFAVSSAAVAVAPPNTSRDAVRSAGAIAALYA
ncbi:MAG: hypothetical protein NWT00_07325, partial [Beijerinckiaceae bacterium]|nr:hypothetical protein [Beijerinckiaceae bacterium]